LNQTALITAWQPVATNRSPTTPYPLTLTRKSEHPKMTPPTTPNPQQITALNVEPGGGLTCSSAQAVVSLL